MIALTQEKREELIDHNSQKLKSLKYNIKEATIPLLRKHLEIEIQSTEVALASLTAAPEHYIFKHPFAKSFYSLVDESCKGYDEVYPVYAAPPVPEINTFSELTELLNAIVSFQEVTAKDRWNESGKWDDANDKLSAAAIKAEPVIKRLNGLGSDMTKLTKKEKAWVPNTSD